MSSSDRSGAFSVSWVVSPSSTFTRARRETVDAGAAMVVAALFFASSPRLPTDSGAIFGVSRWDKDTIAIAVVFPTDRAFSTDS